MRRLPCVTLLAIGALAAACAPRTIPLPVVTTAAFPEFIKPGVPRSLAASRAAATHERAWVFLQAGDLRNAEREMLQALKLTPGFYPADAALGYLALARKDLQAAVATFNRALDREQAYVPALVGRGLALLALDREGDALQTFEAALAADPSLADLQRQVEVLRFRGQQRNLAKARAAASSGRSDEAIRGYLEAIARSPDSAFLYRELALVERRRGEGDVAIEHFRRAVALEPGDADSLVQIGELLEARGDLEGALKAYRAALAIEPTSEIEDRSEQLQAKLELARLPEPYRAIEQSLQVTRGDVAALVGVRLGPLLQTRSTSAAVITDIRGHWAEAWIMAVTRAGVLEPFANHTFQPRGLVRRVDFAQAVSRLLTRIAAINPVEARAWQNARLRFPDLAATHLAHPAASASVAAGVLRTGQDGGFQPNRALSGMEALSAMDRLEALANPGRRRAGPR